MISQNGLPDQARRDQGSFGPPTRKEERDTRGDRGVKKNDSWPILGLGADRRGGWTCQPNRGDRAAESCSGPLSSIGDAKKMKIDRPTAVLALALAVAAAPAEAELTTEHLSSDGELLAILPEVSFVCEGRIGDRGGTATFELDIGSSTSAPSETAQHAWTSGFEEPFEVAYHPATGIVTFALGAAMLTYAPDLPLTDLFLRTRATLSGTSARLFDLSLNGETVNDASAADGDAAGIDILRVRGADLARGFALTGKAVFEWTGTAPTQSRLAFQIQAGEAQATTGTEPISWGGVKTLFR